MQRILTDLARTLDADDARQHAVIAAREVEEHLRIHLPKRQVPS